MALPSFLRIFFFCTPPAILFKVCIFYVCRVEEWLIKGATTGNFPHSHNSKIGARCMPVTLGLRMVILLPDTELSSGQKE